MSNYKFSFARMLEIAVGFALGTLGGWFLVNTVRYTLFVAGS